MVFLSLLILSGCKNKTIQNTYKVKSKNMFRFPLDKWEITQDMGNFNTNANRYHTAEDAKANPGTPVYSIADGEISYSGPAAGYGWLIIIDHPKYNVYSLYGHVSTKRWKKTEGKVKTGDVIAYIADGDEDGSNIDYWDWGSHLHFGIRTGSRYDYPGDASDSRFTAGYTYAYPMEIGWLDPTDYINSKLKSQRD